MANVLFKRGLQKDLAALMASGATDGCFYLTTDSHRLYVGQNVDGVVKALPVNEGVETVANLSELTSRITAATTDEAKELLAGSFYYVSDDNILCVFNGKEFVQINPNTNTDVRVESMSAEVTGDNDKVTVTLTLQQKLYDPEMDVALPDTAQPASLKDPIVVPFEISKELFNALITEVAVSLSAVVNESGTEVSLGTTGVGADNAQEKIIFKAGTNISFTSDAAEPNVVTIVSSDTTYDLAAQKQDGAVKLVLSSSDDLITDDEVQFKAGTDLTVDSDGSSITFSHATYEEAKEVVAEEKQSLAHGATVKIIDSLTVSNGHVTGYNSTEYQLPADNYIIGAELEKDENGALTGNLVLHYADTLMPSLTVDLTSTFANGNTFKVGGTLDAYTTTEIDDKLKALSQAVNSMTYRGTVGLSDTVTGTVATLPSSDVSIGDTYMVAVADTYGGQDCRVGDLLIAISDDDTEDSNGHIESGKLRWTLVPAGNDLDSQYTLSASETTEGARLSLKNTTDSLASEDIINITDDANDILVTLPNANEINIAHKVYSAPVAETDDTKKIEASAGETITVVDSVETSNGHITKVISKEIVLPADTTYKASVAESVDENNATITNSADIVLTPSDTLLTAEKVTVKGERQIDVAVNKDSNEIVVKHSEVSTEKTENTLEESLTSGGTFTVVDSVNVENGHITGYNLTTFTLPESDTYTYEGSVAATEANDGVVFTSTLKDSFQVSQGEYKYTLASQSLNISADANNVVTMNMVWGSF